MPLTSVGPHVGLEAVVVLVLLATDPAFIGPWKTARERAHQPTCHHQAQDPQVSLGRDAALADKGAPRTSRESRAGVHEVWALHPPATMSEGQR